MKGGLWKAFTLCTVFAPLSIMCATYLNDTDFNLNSNLLDIRPFEKLSRPYIEFIDDVLLGLQGKLNSFNITSQCQNATQFLVTSADSGDKWALQFIDAIGKPSSGLLEGGIAFPGFYSECTAAAATLPANYSKFGWNQFTGQYCLVTLNLTKSLEPKDIPQVSWIALTSSQKVPTVGLCVPSLCLLSDVNAAVSAGSAKYFNGSLANVSVCYTKQNNFSKDGAAIGVLSLFIIFMLIAVCATAYDVFSSCQKSADKVENAVTSYASTEMLCEAEKEKSESRLRNYILAFSLKTNASKIFTVESHQSGNINALHGLRFFSMVLIILGHTYSFALQNLFIRNPGTAYQAPKDFLSQAFANGTIAVDTFYFISGLLVAFVTLKAMAKTDGKLPLLYFYAHRYFRLTPVMMAVVAFCAVLLRHVGSGPNWLSTIQMFDVWCKKNWWINALYLNNFINTEDMCLGYTWYLATDMQFYLITPLILIPLYRNLRYGVVALTIFFIATVLTTAIITAVNHYPAIPYMNNILPLELVNAYYSEVYIKPYCRMGPYLVGIVFGYFLLKKKELVLSKLTVTVIWICSVGLGLTVIYLMWPANQGRLPSDAEAAAYSALARSVWAVGLGWLVIACVYGYSGFINNLLSWPPLIPFSRLTYCAYLIHPIVMNIYYGTTEILVDFSYHFMMYLFFGNLIATYMLAFILSLLFESPFVGLERALIKKKSS